jgi:hypothetical protein
MEGIAVTGAAAAPVQSMRALKNAHRGERAIAVLGGPSLIAGQFDFGRLRDKGAAVFVEAKALTPQLIASGLVPDYFVMSFPEKCASNAFQTMVYRAFLAGYAIERFVRPEFLPTVETMRARFDEYLEPWRPHRGAHKTYRWRTGVELADSPSALLDALPGTRLLANGPLLARQYPGFRHANQRYEFEYAATPEREPLTTDRYYDVDERDGAVVLRDYGFLNSGAIALYPLLKYMGFRTAYFLGMDMSMVGTMEYAAPFTFKSMIHYRWFFHRTRHVFNASYKPNRPWFIRPRSEFADLEAVLDPEQIDFVRVYMPYKYTVPTPFMHSIDEAGFWAC